MNEEIKIQKIKETLETLQVLEEAKKNVRRFQLQLKTIELPMRVKKDVEIFVSFATFILDGTVENYLMKENVNDVTEQLDDAVEMIEAICKNIHV